MSNNYSGTQTRLRGSEPVILWDVPTEELMLQTTRPLCWVRLGREMVHESAGQREGETILVLINKIQKAMETLENKVTAIA